MTASPPAAFTYFFDEVCGSCLLDLFRCGKVLCNTQLELTVAQRAKELLGPSQEVGPFMTNFISEFLFFHGTVIAPGCVLVFCYFECLNRGLLAVVDNSGSKIELCGFVVDPATPGPPGLN